MSYNHELIENKWRKKWDELQLYKWDENGVKQENFSIDTPPPTVSGLLHMGHAFSYVHADFIARFWRMKGKNVYYPIGFDDNGLSTERLVEKTESVLASKLARADFINLCNKVAIKYEEDFRNLFKAIGLSVDWSLEYQTINPQTTQISQMSFLDLFHKGIAVRNFAPTFWDYVDRTALAQAEIEDKEKNGLMYNIAFQDAAGNDLIIATTRPELIAAVVAVFYNPDDSRYQHLKDQEAITPIYNAKVPILADSHVNMEKGTGLVMCATFGDIQDIEWWRQYSLETKVCIGFDGKMINADMLNGMKINEAKKYIVEHLTKIDRLRGQQEVTQFVKCAERSGAVLEIIPTYQWYISVLPHKEALLNKARQCQWHPEYMRIRLENWINGLNQDWCISRQRFFGVPFPIWYSKRPGEEGKILIASSEQLPVDPLIDLPNGYTRDEVDADVDVMDTWATSSVTPQINSLALNNDYALDANKHSKIFPFDLRSQAHEIIRTWAFTTIVKSHFHDNTIPWKHVMLSGWCLATDKTKMSKSKGNVITPNSLIEQYGTDVVRYWASSSKLGVDTALEETQFTIGKKLVTKLWNASKFAGMHLQKLAAYKIAPHFSKIDVERGLICESLDKWILSKLHNTIKCVTKEFERFEYCDARGYIEEFFWKDFCDNYLELVKGRIYSEEPDNDIGRRSAVYTTYHCLQAILLLFAPFIPYITEELNEILGFEGSVHQRGRWPKLEDYFFAAEDIELGDEAIVLVELIRKYKSAQGISLKTPLEYVHFNGTMLNESMISDLKNVSNALVVAYKSETLPLVSADQKYSIDLQIKRDL